MYSVATVGLLPAGRAGRKQGRVGCTGNIFVTCWSEWKWVILSYCCQRHVKYIVALGVGAMFFLFVCF